VKSVLSAPNAAEAHVAVAVLANAGIEGVIRGEHMGALPFGPASRPSVWVRDEDYDAACEVLGVVPEPPTNTTQKSPVWLLVTLIFVLILFALLRG
jgi:hypothetical protein